MENADRCVSGERHNLKTIVPRDGRLEEATDVVEIDNVLGRIRHTTRTNRKRHLRGISSRCAEKKGNGK